MRASEIESLFAEVYQRYVAPEIGPDEFTVRDFANASNIPWNNASMVVKRAVKDGLFVAVGKRRLPDGSHAQAFRKA